MYQQIYGEVFSVTALVEPLKSLLLGAPRVRTRTTPPPNTAMEPQPPQQVSLLQPQQQKSLRQN